jgi:hypothetical protein
VILPKGCQFTPQAKGLGGWTLKPRSRLRYSYGLGSGRPEIAFDQGPQLRGHFGRFAEPQRKAAHRLMQPKDSGSIGLFDPGGRGNNVDTFFIQIVPLLIWYVIGAIPAFLVVRRTGMSGWWGLLLLIPIFGFVIVLWVVAFARWPRARSRRPYKCVEREQQECDRWLENVSFFGFFFLGKSPRSARRV